MKKRNFDCETNETERGPICTVRVQHSKNEVIDYINEGLIS